MKKILIVLLAVAILAAASIALAVGVSGTKHDVRVVKGVGVNSLEPCAWCHTPHQGSVTTYPLWNRSQATQNYTPYSSSTFDMGETYKAKANLDEGSAPCMVCHNGVESTLVNYPGRGNKIENNLYDFAAGAIGTSNTFADLGTDLKNEHPVSFTYDNKDDDSTQNNDFPSYDVGKIIATGMTFPLYAPAGSGAATEFGCATCHTVHHTPTSEYMNTATGSYQVYFLRMSNEGSAMCAACHVNRY